MVKYISYLILHQINLNLLSLQNLNNPNRALFHFYFSISFHLRLSKINLSKTSFIAIINLIILYMIIILFPLEFFLVNYH
jgi:hypothetical protein